MVFVYKLSDTFVKKNATMKIFFSFFVGLFVILSFKSAAQKIDYSEPGRDDVRSTSFEIIGKINGNYLVYKTIRISYAISVFDESMKETEKVPLDFLPEKIINSDIIAFRDYFYFIYQYQKKNIVYCMAAKMDGLGKIMGEPKQLDTTMISFFASNKIYNVLFSEDKQKIAIFKINSKNPNIFLLTSSLFNNDLSLISKQSVSIPMSHRNDFLSEFLLDNQGTLAFLKASGTSQNDNISDISLLAKAASVDTLSEHKIEISKIYLDELKLKTDNVNKHFLIASFYSKQRHGNIDGIFCMVFNKDNQKEINAKSILFTEEMRTAAKDQGNPKLAFNDFFLQDIIMRKDGGFAVSAEAVYSSTRGSYTNRWDYPYNSPFLTPSDYYYWNSPYSYYYPWGTLGTSNLQQTRYFADNIAIMSFDSAADLQWSNVIPKSQYDDLTDNFIGYGTFKTSTGFNFLFNQLEKRDQLLNMQSVDGKGQITRSPTLKNLDKGYEFMPRYAKQVSSREVIIPCQYRNYLCFAKIVF